MINHQEIILAALLSVSIVISNSALFNVIKVSRSNKSKSIANLSGFVSLVLCLSFKLNSFVVLYLLYAKRSVLHLGEFLSYFCVFLLILVMFLSLIRAKDKAS